MDSHTRAFLITIRAALIMAVKAIEKYMEQKPELVTLQSGDDVAGYTISTDS